MSKSQTHVTNSRISNKPTWKCIKNQSKEVKSKSDNEMITNLETDLALVMFEKIKLQNDNALLNVELQACRDKVCILETKSAQNSESISKLQDDLKQAMFKLTDKDQLYCEMEKKYLTKINSQNEAYNAQLDSAIAKENCLCEQIADMKAQLQKSEENLKLSSEQLRESKNKRNKYREKLKFCVDLITKLNGFFNEVLRTKPSTNQYCQTDVTIERSNQELHKSLECENIVLSELFFKENPFVDSLEEVFFMQ